MVPVLGAFTLAVLRSAERALLGPGSPRPVEINRRAWLPPMPAPGCTADWRTTPPKVQPGLTDAERWRQAGLTPEGRPLDPKAFE